MKKPRIVSREYKLMLKPAKFAGGEAKLLRAAGALWRDVARIASGLEIGSKGALDTITKRRSVTFVDTSRRHIERAGYVFRKRTDADTTATDVTLKFRHADRYIAEGHVTARAIDRAKFEADIKAQFQSLYSFSASRPLDRKKSVSVVRDVRRLFPVLKPALKGLGPDTPIKQVSTLVAAELVIGGPKLKLGTSRPEQAECALIIWYDADRDAKRPVAAEFSYRYGSKSENYSASASTQAFTLFHALQDDLGRWIDRSNMTKTALALG